MKKRSYSRKESPEMKKYHSASLKKIATVTALCLAATLISVILMFEKEFDFFFLALFFIWMDFLCFIAYFAEKSRYLTIDHEKVLFPRGVGNGRKFFQRTMVKFCDIQSFESKLIKQDDIFLGTGEYFHHTLTLKDGTILSVYLYAYGKEAETEIVETICGNIT
jgi:hypothetical protein